jgi:hypothetical protein
LFAEEIAQRHTPAAAIPPTAELRNLKLFMGPSSRPMNSETLLSQMHRCVDRGVGAISEYAREHAAKNWTIVYASNWMLYGAEFDERLHLSLDVLRRIAHGFAQWVLLHSGISARCC